jgi:peptidoglycan L-alanyl-D-glutamate endopeptidase CwlK
MHHVVLAALVCGIGCAQQPAADGPSAPQLPVVTVQDVPAGGNDAALKDKLVAAYPDFLKGWKGNAIVWHDGTEMPWDDGRGDKPFAELEAAPDLEDMFAFAYPTDSIIFRENYDPGRIRNEAFFKKMYGATAAQVSARLVSLPWLSGTPPLKVSSINGIDKALAAVTHELEALPTLHKYLVNPGGTFNWRMIAGTDRLSAHSYGMAIDINTSYTDYWRWGAEFKAGKPLVYRNRIPLEIVQIFERHGFIWGGKWYHYDTMHFEYRPELL